MTELAIGLWLDLIGTFVFAISGAMLAVRRGLDIFGIAVLSVAAGLAGGIVRDLLLGATPPAAFADPRYLTAALAAAGAGFVFHRTIDRLSRPVMVLDALGLGLFAVSGCTKALAFGLGPLPAILLGVLTAVGGGVVRDMLVADVPRVLREEVYALAALVGATMIWAAQALELDPLWSAVASIAAVFAVRVLSVVFGWRAPRAPGTG
jgi:uncharacterized membrane protein YeiH